jgi:hypothetical protein
LSASLPIRASARRCKPDLDASVFSAGANSADATGASLEKKG